MTKLPETLSLADWINPVYADLHARGELERTCVKTEPFRHAVFTDFFKENVIDAIRERARSIQTSPGTKNIGIARRAAVEWGPYADIDVLRFLCGAAFRPFLKTVLGGSFVLRKNWVPQLAHFHPHSQGYDIHNDMDEPRDSVLLINLTHGYPPGGGGELCIYDQNFKLVKRIEPQLNTVVLFRVSRHSWHGVSDMQGDWTRRNILLDWDAVG